MKMMGKCMAVHQAGDVSWGEDFSRNGEELAASVKTWVGTADTAVPKSQAALQQLELRAKLNQGILLHNQGDYSGARPLLEEAAVMLEAANGPLHQDTCQAKLNLAALLARTPAELGAARRLTAEVVAVWSARFDHTYPGLKMARDLLEMIEQGERQWRDAVPAQAPATAAPLRAPAPAPAPAQAPQHRGDIPGAASSTTSHQAAVFSHCWSELTCRGA
jgi:hypothetical protein